MSNLATSILSIAKSLPEGAILSPKEFLHLGTREAIDQTFSRLTREGAVLRVGRGSYTLPVTGRFGSRAPSTEAVIASIETQCGETIVSTGAAAANALGLTTQVPVRESFITSGRERTLQLGSRTIELKHGARWQTKLGNRAAGMAIRAVAWAGSERASETLSTLKNKLPSPEWEAIMSSRAILPGWMAKAVSEVAHG